MRWLEVVNKLKKSSFVKNISLYTISSYLNKAIPFLLLPILTRFLSTEEYGEVSMFTSLTTILIAINGWSVDGALLRKYYDSREKLSTIVFNYSIILFSSLIVSFFIVFLFQNQIEKYIGVSSRYLFKAVIFSLFSVLCNCCISLYQAGNKPLQFGLFVNLWTFLNAILSILFVVVFHLGVEGRINGILFSTIIFGVTAIIIIIKDTGISFRFDYVIIKDELKIFGIPSLPMNIRGTILSITDRIFITNMIGLSAAGVYTAGNQMALVLDVFVRSIALAFTPWTYKELSVGSDQIKKVVIMSIRLFLLIVLAGLFWLLLSFFVIPILLDVRYSDASNYSFWLILGKILMGCQLIVVNFIYFYKKTRVYGIISILSIILNIVLNYYFIIRFDSVGAAIATFFVYAFTFVLTVIYVIYFLKCKLKVDSVNNC